MSGREGRQRPAPPDRALAGSLVRWFRTHRRPLPWRQTPSPYRTWVAEVLLQQTRVEQAVPYFERFLRQFPTVEKLAAASTDEVLKAWQGAGYYARARNLHRAARVVVDRYSGRLPRASEELERLPGVGPYIARAIASLAFGEPVIALEANGRRVAARWWADTRDVRERKVSRSLEERLGSILPPRQSAPFNEALMELGETLCTPRRPRCPECPVRRGCGAYATLEDPGAIPVARPKAKRPHVRASVLVAEAGDRFLLQRRPERGLLGGLFEFPGGKIEPGETPLAAARREWREETGQPIPRRLSSVGVVRHAYSHFTVELHIFRGTLGGEPPRARSADQRWVRADEIRSLPLPKATEKIVDRLALDRPIDRPRRGSRT